MLPASALEAAGPVSWAAHYPPQLELHVELMPGNEGGNQGGKVSKLCPRLLEKALPLLPGVPDRELGVGAVPERPGRAAEHPRRQPLRLERPEAAAAGLPGLGAAVSITRNVLLSTIQTLPATS